jgi:UDP-glucuronate 4-epimerase
MSPFLFADAILHGKPISVFNHGDMLRDFTYIDDIVEGVVKVLDKPARPNPKYDPAKPDPSSSNAPYRIFNIGNSQPEKLMDFIGTLENAFGRKAEKNYLPMQPGDVKATYADTSALEDWIGFTPNTALSSGVAKFARWYREFYKL